MILEIHKQGFSSKFLFDLLLVEAIFDQMTAFERTNGEEVALRREGQLSSADKGINLSFYLSLGV
jgi:hypothetical protein